MSERQAQGLPVVVWEGAPTREERRGNVIPFPQPVRETRETTVVEWVVGGTNQQPRVRLTGVSSGFGDVTEASVRAMAA